MVGFSRSELEIFARVLDVQLLRLLGYEPAYRDMFARIGLELGGRDAAVAGVAAEGRVSIDEL